MSANIANSGMSVRKAILFEGTGFGLAEIGSIGVSLGTIAILDKAIPAPILDGVSHTIAKVCVEPFLDPIEKVLGLCKLEECKIDKTKPREERADKLARVITLFGTAWVASMLFKLGARSHINNLIGVSNSNKAMEEASHWERFKHHFNPVNSTPEDRMIFWADEGVHIGSLLFMNTRGAEATDEHIRATSNMLQKVGLSEKKAKELSSMIWVWELPNIAGAAAGLAAIFGKHAYNLPRLSELKHSSMKDILSGVAKSEHSISGH